MNEQDKAFARKALEAKTLTIEQVQEIRTEVDRSGRSFEEIALAKGLIAPKPKPAPPPPKAAAPPAPKPVPAPAPPPAKSPLDFLGGQKLQPLYIVLLAASFLIFSGLLIATVVKMRERSRQDVELALETEQKRIEAERQAIEAGRSYRRAVVSGNEAVARGHLDKARAAMARAEKAADAAELAKALNEAFVGYNTYLKELPDDVDVRIERAKTHELRRNYDLAIADLEHAINLRRDLEPALRDRITQLRLFLARNPR